MAFSRAAFTLKLNGQTLVLTAVTENGSTVTVYSDAALTSAVTLPATLTSDTTYYVDMAGQGTRNLLLGITQVDGTDLSRSVPISGASQPLVVAPVPSETQLAADVGGAGGFESGLLAALPANGARVDGSTYFATDQNGGTVYRMVAGVWTQQAPGVNAGTGMIAGPVYLSSAFDIKAVANTETDVTGMSIAVPASSKTVVVRCKCEIAANGGTATSGTVLSAWLFLTDASNVNKAFAGVAFTSTGSSVTQTRDLSVELVLDAPVSAATYKLRAMTSIAIPANWTSMSINPQGGLVSGGKDALTAIAY